MRNGFTLGSAIVFIVLLAFLSYFSWLWIFCRFYVPAEHMAIITAKEGKDLSSGQILAKAGEKGVLEDPLAEGRYFRNPVFYEWKIVPAVKVPAGKVGIVTSKVGTELPPGEFLAEKGQKGVWRRVLGPGLYRLNPVGYKVDLLDAVSIPIGYVGVITSLSGEKAPEGAFAGDKQKGVREDILQPGLYYLNSNAFKVDVIEVGLNQVSILGEEGGKVITKGQMDMQNQAMEELQTNMLQEQKRKRESYIQQEISQTNMDSSSMSRTSGAGSRKKTASAQAKEQKASIPAPIVKDGSITTLSLSQFVEFPSRDGFEIRLDMTLEFEILPEKVSEVYLRYGDLPAVVDKIIMPQILSISRLKGSSYKAQDFIVGEGREKFQDELRETLSEVLGKKDITIHNSLIRHVDVPNDILTPIQMASVAVERNLTNIQKQETAKKRAELNTQESMIDQRRQEVMQETEKIVAEIAAQKESDVASINAQTGKKVADIAKDTAAVRADMTRKIGETKGLVTSMVEGEKAKGFQMKTKAVGDPESYAWMNFAEGLNPAISIKIIHSGQGTLWTDLEHASPASLGGASVLGGNPTEKK